ncbi:MAG TPA: DUF4178 domain-containing protein [Verrucomicrobiae bacterium]|jgi:hypothetical protein|nr:DUF4178 domain-containing protein [Verrucomicrobiae bacterium]
MRFANPTQIHPGQSATFQGSRYRVIGRAVLGVVETGRNYYWTELYLETSSGNLATLVFEESEGGPAWRLFKMFEPQAPLTAEEAATKREGDQLQLDGSTVWVTRVDKSWVWHVEGKTPEAVQTGQQANYFNAEAGNKIIVVSWTRDEVEYYDGYTISARDVALAFGLKNFAGLQFVLARGRRWSNPQIVGPIGIVAIILVVVLAVMVSPSWSSHQVPVALIGAGPSPLSMGASGTLNGVKYRVSSHTLMEIAEVGARFQRHEYTLTADDGTEAILAHGGTSLSSPWTLYTPLPAQLALTPKQAGACRRGQSVTLENGVARITELFRCTIRQTDNTNFLSLKPGEMMYGFNGRVGAEAVMVRWNEVNLNEYQESVITPQAARAAFGL